MNFCRRSDTSSQYWMGAVRDPKDRTVWRWTGSGDEISVSFWSQPQGTPRSDADCARYDGSRGWLWSDTPCNARLNYICQHRKFFTFVPLDISEDYLLIYNFTTLPSDIKVDLNLEVIMCKL